MVQDERHHAYMDRRLKEEENNQSSEFVIDTRLEDLAQLTKSYYKLIARNKELIEENEKLKKRLDNEINKIWRKHRWWSSLCKYG